MGWGADWLTLRHGHGLRVCGSWLGLLVSGRRAERVRLREGEKRAAPPPVCRVFVRLTLAPLKKGAVGLC